ncbi:hypothetical protein OJ996_22085 [Luteolibacter sp. GHJ8]|uniref:Uncharacterized protein n=1 Tax=Luteolibacter rhizosphaerae TaxID=2989719 RepID=A0ABT3GAN9_9BACT|nr:hypothetical protein [Luteolibacter rhizosphaerae]MCW1916295.1 hypothetical protein [Luteolibacter rhizosphaerae]
MDPELRKLEQAAAKASEAHQLALDKHPKLQELNAQMAAANAKLEAATEAKDEAGKAAADEEISKLADRLMETADKEPELKRLGTAMHKATIALMEREDQVRANHPLTKELFAREEALQRQIDAELEAHPESETE